MTTMTTELPRIETFKHPVRTKVSAEELQPQIDELKEARLKLAMLDSAKKRASKAVKDHRDLIEELTANVCASTITTEVECFERKVWENNTLEIVRADTGEVVEERAMTAEERQADLFDQESGEGIDSEAPFDSDADEDTPAIVDPETILQSDIGDIPGAHEPKATRSRKAKAE